MSEVGVSPLSMRPLFDQKRLNERLDLLGREISKQYGQEEVVVVCVLKGAFIFCADLVRHITSPVRIEFIGVSSYEGTQSTGQVKITHDLTTEIHGKHVLLVEDIIDTGRTIDFLLDVLSVRQPKSLKVCALLTKPEVAQMRHKINFLGFEITKEFVVGYGLDLDGRYRELPYIAQIDA